jgi:hypothetical protein
MVGGAAAPTFLTLTLALDGSECLASCRGEWAAGIHWAEDWVGLRARMDTGEERNHTLPGIEPVSHYYTEVPWLLDPDQRKL